MEMRLAEETPKRMRDYNVDLLRVIAMGMIVFQHLITHSSLMDLLAVGTIQWYVWLFLYARARVAVNCFVLITGYYGQEAAYKRAKVFTLWGRTIFYSVIISMVFMLAGHCGIKQVAKSCIPIITKEYWFITVYLVLYLFSPYLNKFLKCLSGEEFKRLIFLMTVIFVIWKSIFPFLSTLDDTGGFGLLWFVYLYVLGAYLRENLDVRKIKRYWYLAGYLVCIAVIGILKIFMTRIGQTALVDAWYGYNTIFLLGASVSLFLFFASGRQHEEGKAFCRVIKWLSPVVLDIYLVSEQTMVREVLFTDWLKVPEMYAEQDGLFFGIRVGGVHWSYALYAY